MGGIWQNVNNKS